VVKDEVPVEQPNDARNPDSDEALGMLVAWNPHILIWNDCWHWHLEQDEKEAIDKSNILKGGRTRGATKPAGTYQEPQGEDDLPAEDSISAVR